MWIFLLLLITSASTDKNEECEENKFKRTSVELLLSFLKFTNDIQSFFHINLNKFEQRRIIIKKALYSFFEEAFKSESQPNKTIVKLKREEKIRPYILIDEIINSHGFKAESHTVVTTDGYVLILHRILKATPKESNLTRGVVLLHHGLLGSSEDWVLLGPKKSLPYLLVNAHFDVWLANGRGNKYSKGHVSRMIDEDEFWNFSWHEIGQYDLSAVIDYIRNQNENNLQMHFIGHSMGCTALLALLSIYPRYNHVLTSAILLAPLAFMYEVRGPLRLLSEFYSQNKFVSLKFLGINDFVPLQYFPKNFIEKFCKGNSVTCYNPLLLLANGGQEISNITIRNNVLSRVPAGGSMKTIVHYIQLIKSGQFQMFDMGTIKNLKIYGKFTPPIYRLNDVTLPVAIFSSADDWLSTMPDVQSLLSNLPNSVMHHIIKRYDFSHTDFVWAEDADILIYYLVLDLLRQTSLETSG